MFWMFSESNLVVFSVIIMLSMRIPQRFFVLFGK